MKKAAVVLAYAGAAILAALHVLAPIAVILTHSWPWFHPEPSFIQAAPPSLPSTFWVCLGILLVALVVRLARTNKPLSVLVQAGIGTVGWYIHSHIVLGTASYFIFRWLLDRGPVVAPIYMALSFLGGLGRGFLGAQGFLLYLVYRDPQLLTVALLPAVIGELIDSFVGDVSEKDG